MYEHELCVCGTEQAGVCAPPGQALRQPFQGPVGGQAGVATPPPPRLTTLPPCKRQREEQVTL